jgi:putative restriction endonuclease
MDALTLHRIVKASADVGFTIGPAGPDSGGWLVRRALDRGVTLWITTRAGAPVIAADDAALLAALGDHGAEWDGPELPVGAVGARAHAADDYAALTFTLRRLDQLAAALPPSPLREFEKALAEVPAAIDPVTGATEAEAVRRVRIGQGIYRKRLMDLWDGRCAISGLAVPELLRASHAKPWAECESDAERLDVFNGLLLAAHLDAAFDVGLIAITDDGDILVSPELDGDARRVLGLPAGTRLEGVQDGHTGYLAWHRQNRFRRETGAAPTLSGVVGKPHD